MMFFFFSLFLSASLLSFPFSPFFCFELGGERSRLLVPLLLLLTPEEELLCRRSRGRDLGSVLWCFSLSSRRRSSFFLSSLFDLSSFLLFSCFFTFSSSFLSFSLLSFLSLLLNQFGELRTGAS